eukprot:CAMPEP_0170551752 /NCGR_PEP_ID=MMETSP0211-20121228/9753_1 /TAXON_ID=311385 /ORGANISM="Pseudokeronopsis sp., Strain OXSARD2" /LENGTH=55 /DNA_ID=CAMNT_0010859111 /DNA_START=292 /DNA_END=459 /DNA_ORIENTATION=+
MESMEFDEEIMKTFTIVNMKAYVGNEFKLKSDAFNDGEFGTNYDFLKKYFYEKFG